jgi:hypothetical protein
MIAATQAAAALAAEGVDVRLGTAVEQVERKRKNIVAHRHSSWESQPSAIAPASATIAGPTPARYLFLTADQCFHFDHTCQRLVDPAAHRSVRLLARRRPRRLLVEPIRAQAGTHPARATALKIMSGLDLGPKICLVLFLPSGVTLMALDPHGAGIFTWWLVALTWLGAGFWLWLTIKSHHQPIMRVRNTDWAIRITFIIGLGSVSIHTLAADRPFGVDTNPKWLGARVFLYTVAIACGHGTPG